MQAMARDAGEASGDEGELAALNDEADMPLEQLMALYGYIPGGAEPEEETGPPETPPGNGHGVNMPNAVDRARASCMAGSCVSVQRVSHRAKLRCHARIQVERLAVRDNLCFQLLMTCDFESLQLCAR